MKFIAISNREDYFVLTLIKSEDYYEFLFKLLKYFHEKIPDILDENGKLPEILNSIDNYSFYGETNIKIIETFGEKKLFLFIQTDQREKLTKFIELNCKFIKVEHHLEKKIRNELIKIYEKYLILEDKDLILEEAQKTYNNAISAKSFISENLIRIATILISLTFSETKSGREKPTKEEIKEILKKLKSLEKKNS